MEAMNHIGTCPGLRFATANVAVGDTPIWTRRQPGTSHTHPVYVLEFVKHGCIEFQVDGGQRLALGPGSYYIVPPGLPHSHEVQGEISTIHVAFRPEFVRSIVAEAVPDVGTGVLQFPMPARAASPALEGLLRRIVQEARQVAPWRRLLSDTLATELVVQLVRDHGVSAAEEEQVEADGVSRAIELILANFDRDLTLDALAAEAGMSRYHFVRVFKERTGTTPGAYLRQVRVEQAAQLLRSTDLSVTAVALQSGFAGATRLAEAIRQAYGVAPSQLRDGGRP